VAAALSGVIAIGVALLAVAVLRDVRPTTDQPVPADDDERPGRPEPAIAEPC